jgi:hypothetical protein
MHSTTSQLSSRTRGVLKKRKYVNLSLLLWYLKSFCDNSMVIFKLKENKDFNYIYKAGIVPLRNQV